MNFTIPLIVFAVLFVLIPLVGAPIFGRKAWENFRARVYWLLDKSYLFFAEMILPKPVRKYRIEMALVLWVTLDILMVNFMVKNRPTIYTIPPAYIPFFTYLVLVTALYSTYLFSWLSLKLVNVDTTAQ